MHLKDRLSSALAVSTATLFVSFIIPLIPCKMGSSLPGSVARWGLCDLNPDIYRALTVSPRYWGLSTSLAFTIIFTFFLVGALTLFLAHSFAKHKSRRA